MDAPEALVDALAELGEGRIALVADADGKAEFAPTSLAAKVQGPLAIRRLLAHLHGADDLAQAQQLAAFCVTGFERERPELAALALVPDALWLAAATTGAGADIAALARQVRALGQAGDLLLAITIVGNEPAMLEAVQAAHERDMTVVALTGRDGGALATLLRETDVQICVPHDRPARVREVHALVLHCLCDGVDAQLLGEQENPI